MAEVYLADGRRMHLEDEVEEAIARRDADIAPLRRLLEER
jgi:hypothetical protein